MISFWKVSNQSQFFSFQGSAVILDVFIHLHMWTDRKKKLESNLLELEQDANASGCQVQHKERLHFCFPLFNSGLISRYTTPSPPHTDTHTPHPPACIPAHMKNIYTQPIIIMSFVSVSQRREEGPFFHPRKALQHLPPRVSSHMQGQCARTYANKLHAVPLCIQLTQTRINDV